MRRRIGEEICGRVELKKMQTFWSSFATVDEEGLEKRLRDQILNLFIILFYFV